MSCPIPKEMLSSVQAAARGRVLTPFPKRNSRDASILGEYLPPGRLAAWSGWVTIAATSVGWSTAESWGTTTISWSATICSLWRSISTTAATVSWSWWATEAATAKLTEITVGSAAAGTAAATRGATATATTKASTLTSNILEEGWNLLVGLLEKLKEVTDDTTVATVEERSGDTSVTGTSSTTNAVNVVIDISWEIVVDDMGDVWNIKTTSSNSGSDQDWAASVAEHLESTLTLALCAVTMNGGGWKVLVDQEIRQRIGHALGLNKYEGKTTGVGVEDIQKNGALVHVLNVLDLLGNVLRCRSDTSYGQEDVVLQEIAREHLDVAWEGGTEHEGLAVLDVWHILTLDDATNLWLETHVQHAISLIEDEILDVAKRDAATLDQIDETTRCSDQKITSTLHLAELGTDIGTTVDDAWLDPGAVGELAGLLVNLGNQLTGRSQDEGGWVGLALATEVGSGTGWDSGWTVDEGLGKDWEEETSSLSGTSLGTSHQVTTTHDNRDGVLLDWGWNLVVSKLDVADQVVIQRWVGEGVDWLWDIGSGSLDRDVIILLEVDTGLLLCWVINDTEKLTLDTWVGWTSGVLAFLPRSITASAWS